MSVRMRNTSSRTRNRRSHHALTSINTVVDKKSGAVRLPHRLDETTGSYRGTLIKTPHVKKERTKAQKYDYPEHTHDDVSVVQKDDPKQKTEVQGKHEHIDNVPRTRRGA